MDAINTAISGLQTAAKTVNRAASNIANPAKADNYVEDIVDIKISETAYKANAVVIQTASDMQDELLKTFDQKV
jgi:flagellar hook-associated protein FlgK